MTPSGVYALKPSVTATAVVTVPADVQTTSPQICGTNVAPTGGG